MKFVKVLRTPFLTEHFRWLLLSWSTLPKKITCRMLAYGYNVYEEDKLYNVVSTMLEQHCVRILFSQYCPNTSETTLHKKCWLKAHRYTFAGKPAVSNMSDILFLTAYCITEQSWVFLFNVGSEVYFRIAGQQ